MSTNLHEQSKTCTNIVNDLAAWAEMLEGAQNVVDSHLVACHMRVRVAQMKRSQPALARHPGAAAAAAAAATLQRLGWTYNAPASSWECPPAPAGGEVPGGGLPDWPVGVQTFHERAAYQRGVADGRRVGALRDAAEAVISARYQGPQTVQMDKALGALIDALGGPPHPAFPPPTWDAEECRNAALEVLRLAPDPLHRDSRFGEALRRLAAAVQREQ